MATRKAFLFEGKEIKGKNKLVREIVLHYISQNPDTSLSQLYKTFNTETLLWGANVVETYDDVMKLLKTIKNEKKESFFDEEDPIAFGNEKLVLWNYWPDRYFVPFIDMVKSKLGYKIEITGTSEPKVEENVEESESGDKHNFLVEVTGDCWWTEIFPLHEECDMDSWGDWEDYRDEYNEDHFSLPDLFLTSNPVKIKVYDEDEKVVYENNHYHIDYDIVYPKKNDDFEKNTEADWDNYCEKEDYPELWNQIKDKKKFMTDLRFSFQFFGEDFKEGENYYCWADLMEGCQKCFYVKDTQFDINKLHFLRAYSQSVDLECVEEEIWGSDDLVNLDNAAYDGELVEEAETYEDGEGGRWSQLYKVTCDENRFIEVGEKVLD